MNAITLDDQKPQCANELISSHISDLLNAEMQLNETEVIELITSLNNIYEEHMLVLGRK